MKSSLINLYKGYFSILKYIFTGRNDGRFLQLNFKLPFVLITLMIIGFTRNLLEVAFGINFVFVGLTPSFYSMRPDIIFTMTVFPVYLCFFSAMVFSLFLRLFSKERHDKEILGLCFYLQASHLLVPFFDIFNSKLDVLPYVQILPQSSVFLFVASMLVMTIGIIVVWLLSGIAVIRFLKDICRISPPKIFLIAFSTFNLLFWPIYIIYPIFNYFFNSLFLREESASLFMGGAYDLFYGYAFFFLFLALAGIFYFRKHFSKSRGKAEF